MPTGLVEWRGGSTVPSGWLLCDGAAVSRTTFAALFSVIGTTFGAGDGSTTFNVPALTDSRYVFGVGTSVSLGASGGTLNHPHLGTTHGHGSTPPNPHADHASEGGHQHDAHAQTDLTGGNTTQTLLGPAGQHPSAGSHTHDPHSAHGGQNVGSTSGTTGTAEPPHFDVRPLIKT